MSCKDNVAEVHRPHSLGALECIECFTKRHKTHNKHTVHYHTLERPMLAHHNSWTVQLSPPCASVKSCNVMLHSHSWHRQLSQKAALPPHHDPHGPSNGTDWLTGPEHNRWLKAAHSKRQLSKALSQEVWSAHPATDLVTLYACGRNRPRSARRPPRNNLRGASGASRSLRRDRNAAPHREPGLS